MNFNVEMEMEDLSEGEYFKTLLKSELLLKRYRSNRTREAVV